MENYKIYVAGRFIETPSNLIVENPHTKEKFASTFIGNEETLELAINKAKTIEEEMSLLSSYEKYQILMFISNSLKEDRERIGAVIAQEAGKPIALAIGEVDRTAQTFLVAAEEAKRIPGEYMSIDWTMAGKGKEAWIKYFPIGLVSGISPFNFPLNLAAHKIAPAIAAGCPIILKPATSTPLATLELAKIIDKTTLPKGAVSIIPMDRKSGNLLVTDERFKLLTFTGSPEVGWKMKSDAGKKKVVLELGGNAGVIVSDSADLSIAVPKCVGGAFAYQGQVCIHTQRIFVHENIFNQFIEQFINATSLIKEGSPLDKEAGITSMIDEWNATRVEEWVNEAISDGAILLHGGKRRNAFFEPTVLTNTKKQMKVNCCEVFGPVVTIEKYNNFESVVNLVNETEFGLQAGVFTDRLSEMNFAFQKIEAGGVIINDVPTFRVDHMPYGGIKNSGLGREGLKYAIFDMLEPKILVKNII
ncbi:MAG: aldehyde dehydrogenase family protein [Bacteroidota bacterium]